jgi:Trk K+ transport system NAD-binding subunit
VKFLFSQLSYFVGDQQARRNLTGLLKYCAFVTAVICSFALIFHVLMLREGREYSWVTGLYWTLTVMSTLGFGDITFQGDVGRAFSILVLLTGIFLLLIVLPFAFIRFFYAPWLEAQIRARAPRQVSDDVSGHVILCQADPVALGVAKRLRVLDIPFYVVEPDPTRASVLQGDGLPVVTGEIDSAATYAALRVDRARMVLANLDDAANTNIILTVRERSREVVIVATAEHTESIDLIELAGATHVLPLKQRLGEQLAARVNAGHCEAHVLGGFRDLSIAEFPVSRTPLSGCALRDTQLRQVTGVNVVGVWERGRLVPAQPDTVLSDASVPVVVGTAEQITALNRLVEPFDVNPSPVLLIGGGKVGQAAAQALKRRGVPVHLVEHDAAVAARSEPLVDRVFFGEAADRDVLAQAGIEQTPSVLLTTNDDAMNIYLCIYCRRLNPRLRIVSRVTHERNVEAIHRAGADFALSYASIGVESVLALLRNRELIFVGEGVRFFSVTTPRALDNKRLLDSGIGARTGLNVIAVQSGATTITNPAPDTVLTAGSELLAIGTDEQRRAFHRSFGKAAKARG